MNVLLPKTRFQETEEDYILNSTWLLRQCLTFAKKGFKMSQFCLKLHALWCIAKGHTKRRFWEAAALQWQEPGWAFLWCMYCSNTASQNDLGTEYCSGTLRKLQATIHRQGFINPRQTSQHLSFKENLYNLSAGVRCSVWLPWTLWLLPEMWRVSAHGSVTAETQLELTPNGKQVPSPAEVGKLSCGHQFSSRPWCVGMWDFPKVPGCFCVITKLAKTLSLSPLSIRT